MAGQQAAGGSEVQNALALGWVIADLFYTQMPTPNTPDQSIALDLPSPSELRPMDACRGKLDHAGVLAARLGVDAAKERWDTSRTVLDAALANQQSDSWATGLRDLHIGLLLALEANDAALYHGYDLGRSLRKTCRLPADIEALQTTFGQWRVVQIQERLGDLTDHLPPHSANAVAASIGVWATWSDDDTSSAATRVVEARQRITRQGHLWLAVLTGEKDATGMLDPENFIAASKRLSSQLAKVTSRLLVTYLWQVLLLALAIAFVIVTVIVSGKTASVLASLGALAAALGITRKGVVAEGESVVKRLADDLWDSELDLSIGEALTKLPKVAAGIRGQKQALPAPIERIPASGPDPPRLPQASETSGSNSTESRGRLRVSMRFGAMWALLGTVLAFSTADAHATVYSGSTTFSAPVGTPSLTGPTPDPAQTEEYLHTLSAYYDDRSGSLTIQFSLYDSATWGPSLKDGDGGSGSGGEPLFWPFQFSLGYLGDRQHPASYPGDPTPEVFCDGSGLPGVDQPQLGSPVLSGTIVSTFSDTDNDGDDDGTSTANDADGDGVFAGDTINNVTLEGYSGDLSAPTSFDGTTFTATIQNSAFSGHIWDCLVVNQSIELPLSPPTPPPPIPKLLNPWKGTFSVRPHMIGLSGDGTSFLAGSRQHGRQSRKNPAWPGHIAWSNWTMTQATGSGGNWLDNCRPACANGRYDVHPAQFRAYRPQNGHFTRLWVRVKYSGRWRTHTYKLVHGSGFWYWSW